jgi:hypothetical protein
MLAGRAPDAFESWKRFSAVLDDQGDFLARFIAEQPVQTNEVQRSWVMLPCFLEVARRTGAEMFDVIELGPSAGLNLVWDRYAYRYEAGRWGASDTPLELTGEELTPVPKALLTLVPTIGHRTGIDLRPVDVATDEGARLLKSFVWADQVDRLRRLDRAIEALRADPPELVRGDFVELLPGQLASRRRDVLTVVFQTATLGYVAPEQRRRLRAALEEAGEEGQLAFVSTGRPRVDGATHWGISVQTWPRARELVAEADYHGSWLEWLE